MFLVRTYTRNANRISLTVSALSDNHNECIKSYIQIGDSVRFLSSLSKFAKIYSRFLLRGIFKSTRLTSRYDFHTAPYIN